MQNSVKDYTCVKCGTKGLVWNRSVKGKWYLGIPTQHTFEDGNTVTTHIRAHNCNPTEEGLALYEEQRKEREAVKAEEQARLQAHLDRKASLKHFPAEVGEQITFSGVVTKSIAIDGHYGSQVLTVVETANLETLKIFSTAKWAWETYEGDQVTLTGLVVSHDIYEGDPQTLIKKAKRIN